MIIFQKAFFFSLFLLNKQGFLDLKEIKLKLKSNLWDWNDGLSSHPDSSSTCLLSVNPLLYFPPPYHFSLALHASAYIALYCSVWIIESVIHTHSSINMGLLIPSRPFFYRWSSERCVYHDIQPFFNLSSPIISHYSSCYQSIIGRNSLLFTKTGGVSLQGTVTTSVIVMHWGDSLRKHCCCNCEADANWWWGRLGATFILFRLSTVRTPYVA